MPGPGDALFLALAQAKAQPSKALRATKSAGQAGEDILGGYVQGKELGQKLEQYKLLNTPLGSMYPDPSQIPFGLGPQHTVKDLLTLAPAYENFVPSNLISGAARSFGANVNDGSAPPPSANPAPLGGTSNPAPNPGTAQLQDIQGTGAGAQDNVPRGTPPAITVPPGGMGMKGFQNVVMPALKAGQEERHFNEREANEESRFQRGKSQQESEFQRGHMATVAEKVAPSIANLSNVKQFTSELEPLVANNHPLVGTGNVQAGIARRLGGVGTPQMKNSLSINDTAAKLSAVLDKELAGRFNENEANLLKQTMVPNGNDQPAYAQEKLNKLKAFTSNLETGNDQIIRNMGAAITGGRINTQAPISQFQGQNQNAQNLSQMVTIRDSQGGLHKLPASNLAKAKQRDPGLQVVSQ